MAEGEGEFFGWVGEVVPEGEGGEVEASIGGKGGGLVVKLGGEGGRGGYPTSQSKPSVAVCFFVFSSCITRDWSVSDSAGEASWRSRTFCSGVSRVGWVDGGRRRVS